MFRLSVGVLRRGLPGSSVAGSRNLKPSILTWRWQSPSCGVYISGRIGLALSTSHISRLTRELKMGFERRGEQNCMSHINLHFREKVNIIGGPPGLRANMGLKRKRSTSRLDEEDEEDEPEYSLKKRRRHKKKQKDFFKTISEAGSTSDMDPTSPRRSSVSVSASGKL